MKKVAISSKLIGRIDICDRKRIAGWAMDIKQPERTVSLLVLVGQKVIGEIVADVYRADLQNRFQHGTASFDWKWPQPLPPDECQITIIESVRKKPIKGSPFYIEPQQASLHGSVDVVNRQHVAGWVLDSTHPDKTVWLTIKVNGKEIDRFPANRFRRDIREAGFGNGRSGFDYVFTTALNPAEDHTVEFWSGGQRFQKIYHIPHTQRLDQDSQQYIETLFSSLSTYETQQNALSFIIQQASALKERVGAEMVQVWERHFLAAAQRMGDQKKQDTILNALFIDDRVPDLTRDAGSCAIISHMRALKHLGFNCFFIPSIKSATLADEKQFAEWGITCLMPPFYTTPEDALKALGSGLDTVYLHRLSNGSNYSNLARMYASRAALIWSIADLASLRLQRQSRVENRPEIMREAQRLEVHENMCAWSSDIVLTHSEKEKSLLNSRVSGAKVFVAPWSVILKKFSKIDLKQPIITFIGHYAHAPNADAAKWLILEILPILKHYIPNVMCRLVGSELPHEIYTLKRESVEIIGHVESLEKILSDTAVCIAPLRFGAGIKGKVLESWAHGVPVAMTPIAAEGIVDDSTSLWSLCVRDTPEALAQLVRALLVPALAQENVKDGQKLLRTKYTEQNVRHVLSEILGSVPHTTFSTINSN
ncbi:glycosyltransferase family 4 protein [Acetobacter cibinongensis]|uniref:glycosyltransferase family 4 protein n=1 Tax=Acetobacter cibinongensis TaxID=146475 RepID=UPI0013FE15F9|nr:glycosyltransferase family 4 protein [Acetobacter cibinongensis]